MYKILTYIFSAVGISMAAISTPAHANQSCADQVGRVLVEAIPGTTPETARAEIAATAGGADTLAANLRSPGNAVLVSQAGADPNCITGDSLRAYAGVSQPAPASVEPDPAQQAATADDSAGQADAAASDAPAAQQPASDVAAAATPAEAVQVADAAARDNRAELGRVRAAQRRNATRTRDPVLRERRNRDYARRAAQLNREIGRVRTELRNYIDNRLNPRDRRFFLNNRATRQRVVAILSDDFASRASVQALQNQLNPEHEAYAFDHFTTDAELLASRCADGLTTEGCGENPSDNPVVRKNDLDGHGHALPSWLLWLLGVMALILVIVCFGAIRNSSRIGSIEGKIID